MGLSRRRLLAAGLTLPGLLVLERGVSIAQELAAGAIRAVRPTPVGTSATRCAQCGTPDHSMLDPRCPLAPQVRS